VQHTSLLTSSRAREHDKQGPDSGSDHVLASEVTIRCASNKTGAHWVGGEAEQKSSGPRRRAPDMALGWGKGSGRDEEVLAWVAARRYGGEEETERTEVAPAGGALRLLPIRRLVCADEGEGRRWIGDYFFNKYSTL
jgi:hypothetical protein